MCTVHSPLLLSMVLYDAIEKFRGKIRGMTVGFWKMRAIQLLNMVIVAESENDLEQNVVDYQKEQ